ncbi:hypothetical protein [uncultured Mucilaginibacter sp.]|uniref:hypothetical protein n=1 Tax=uncultured Mucilaginibacter sp. TaxID=797541 RepID=UPI0025FDFFE9|nr:hypothetical protein [uncultured Mucilaginibacter sp.]
MKHFFILLFIPFLFSCKKHFHQTNEIIKVELARSGAWSDYGGAIGVDSSLNYKCYDGNTKRNFIGKINASFWDSINRRFEQIKFKEIPVFDNKNIADATYFELIIYWKDSSKRITRVRDIKPDSVVNAFRWLNDSYKKVMLHQVNYSIKFETTFQDPLPPQPKIDQVKFPPPIKQ